MRKASITTVLVLVSSNAIAHDDLMMTAKQIFKPIPYAIPTLNDNPMTTEKVELGKMLFFDPRLSASGIISCNTCHNLGTGGVDAGPTSVGHGWQRGARRAPTVYNSVFNVAQFWDGRAPDLKAQAKGPVQASAEMNATADHVTSTLNSMEDYVGKFKRAFPRDTPPVTFDNFAKVLEAFEATLTTPAKKRNDIVILPLAELGAELDLTHNSYGFLERPNLTRMEVGSPQGNVAQRGHAEHVLVARGLRDSETPLVGRRTQFDVWFHHAERDKILPANVDAVVTGGAAFVHKQLQSRLLLIIQRVAIAV